MQETNINAVAFSIIVATFILGWGKMWWDNTNQQTDEVEIEEPHD